MPTGFVQTDGGRRDAGFTGAAGDCAARAIAIATGLPYREAYDRINAFAAQEAPGRGRRRGRSSTRTGVHMVTMQRIMHSLGWRWVSTMGIGTGMTTHLNARELPSGRIIVRLSRHFAAVIDGVIHDTHDCSRGGRRGVYGYWVSK